jgi:DNA-binding NtrC family response regulator
MEVLRSWSEAGYGADVIVLTAHGSVDAAVEAIRTGAADFLQKPADFGLLEAAVNRLLSKRQLVRVNQALADQIGAANGIVLGTAPPMTELLGVASRAAQGNATILLTGESGSGKQMLAEYIHQRSPRQNGPFVYVNCVALSDELIESTLFGHERGAFTGAIARKEGRLEAAAGGTAFLDEVGDITPRLQAKLLHFLEAGEFERVGGTRTIHVDCRVIAATNRNLESAVKEAKFREDLYFRLNVFPVQLAPLRDRLEDLPALVMHLAERVRPHQPAAFTADAIALLGSYEWPGNVRELANVVERLSILGGAEVDAALVRQVLPRSGSLRFEAPTVTTDSGTTHSIADLGGRSLSNVLDDYERALIGAALKRASGNVAEAARALQTDRANLYRRMKRLGL